MFHISNVRFGETTEATGLLPFTRQGFRLRVENGVAGLIVSSDTTVPTERQGAYAYVEVQTSEVRNGSARPVSQGDVATLVSELVSVYYTEAVQVHHAVVRAGDFNRYAS